MAKNNPFDEDNLIDQPEMGCYYHTNMFRFPEEDLTRPAPPYNKNQPGMGMGPGMMGPSGGGMMGPGGSSMGPSGGGTPVGGGFTGAATGGSLGLPGVGSMAPSPGSPVYTHDEQQGLPPTLTSTVYTQGFLRTLIGRRVRISFLIGTNLLVDRVGTLLEVGTSYVVLRQIDSNINVMGDLYAIKFVDIYNAQP